MRGQAALLDGTVVGIMVGPIMVGQAAPAGIQDGDQIEHHGSKRALFHHQYNVNNNVIVSNEIYFQNV